MQNRVDRQVPGSVDEVVELLVGVLQDKGLTAAPPDTGGTTDVRIVEVTDPRAVDSAVEVDPDAGTVGTVSISVRSAGDGVQVALIDPLAKAALTDEPDLLDPAQELLTAIADALDSLAGSPHQHDDGDGEDAVGDPQVRRALLDAIHQATTSLDDVEIEQRADVVFTLAKAYTAIVSLERTEEVELHLA